MDFFYPLRYFKEEILDKYIFTSESVTEGHPDKICDAISDAVLDACLAQDPMSRVACETMVCTGFAIVTGEITTTAQVDYPQIIRNTIREIGYTDSSMGFDADTCAVMVAIDKQSPDIAMGVDQALEARDGSEAEEAIAAIDWNCMMLVGSLTAISTGVKNSGAGDAVAGMILKVLGDNPSTFMITTIIFFAAAFLTQVMSNIPTILLFMPIGVSIAEAIGVSPYPICMIITLAGAASYATPFAAPQNMMTVGWTQYKFLDFLKIGIPMLLVTYIVIIAVTPFYLPY